jgi:hypothetical protein
VNVVGDYLGALASDWFALLSGAGSVVLLVLSITAFNERQFPRRVVLLVAFGCFLSSTVRVWGIERGLRKAAEADLAAAIDDRKPNLEGRFEQIVSGDSPDLGKTQVFVLFTVKSLGAPSIAEGWRMEIRGHELSLDLSPSLIPDPFTLSDSSTGRVVMKFHGKEALYEKAIKSIQRGDLVRGWLRFVLPDAANKPIHVPSTTWTMYFSDIVGREYKATYVMSGESGEQQYLPGAELPFVLHESGSSVGAAHPTPREGMK